MSLPPTATLVNPSTFLLHSPSPSTPQSYVKLYTTLTLLINPTPNLHSFLTSRTSPSSHSKDYTLLFTSSHPSHTASTPHFPHSPIAASPLCPLATIPLEDTSLFPHVSLSEIPLTVLHAPGPTRDSLVVFDPVERVLFSGVILDGTFPDGADLAQCAVTLEKLLLFVKGENESGEARVVVAPGRGEYGRDAEGVIVEVRGVLERVVRGGGGV